MADLDALDIGRDLDDPVRIMPNQVGADDVAHDKRCLFGRRSGCREQRATDFFKTLGLDLRHRLSLPIDPRQRLSLGPRRRNIAPPTDTRDLSTQAEIASSRIRLVRGPKPPMTANTISIAAAMNVKTPVVPYSRSKNAIR
jgi:hypothetical protein